MTITILNDPSKSRERFLSILENNSKVICFYYWKNCGHCITFAPIWNKVVDKYKNKIQVINIELESMKKLDKEHMVFAFPSIIVYKNKSKWLDYSKNRTEKDLHMFIKENILDTPKTFKKPKTYTKNQNQQKITKVTKSSSKSIQNKFKD